MKIQRRDFLKTSLAASAAALAPYAQAASAGSPAGREYYELRAYRLKAGTLTTALDAYLEKAVLPALEKRGVKNVGAFSELEVDKLAGTAKPKADEPVWLLIPHATLDSFVDVAANLNADPAVRKAGAAWLDVPKASPAFVRIDVWLYLAFQSMPQIELPEFSKKRVPTRVFEMRDYESYSEQKALVKMAMFDDGETQLMRDLGMSPVFFGQSLAGANLPHLRYITGGSDLASHLAAWAKFPPDPRWKKMSADPKYADSVSKNNPLFLAPRPYSAI